MQKKFVEHTRAGGTREDNTEVTELATCSTVVERTRAGSTRKDNTAVDSLAEWTVVERTCARGTH